jgi:hypothetical protein
MAQVHHTTPLPIFLDTKSKRIIYSDFEDEWEHFPGAYFIPIIGTKTKKFDGHIYIAGATDSGKSYIIQQIVLNDGKQRVPILITDLKTKDETFDKMKYEKFDEDSQDKGWDWLNKNWTNKILIFDDVQFNEKVLKFKDEMLEKGRHGNTTIICVNHRLQDWHKTRVALNDASYIVTFPCSNKGKVFRYLDSEVALDRNENREILKIACNEGRHLILHKKYPEMIATTSSIFKV